MIDKKYEKIGKDINTSVKLNSNIYNPVYEHRTEVREHNIPHSATLYFKVSEILCGCTKGGSNPLRTCTLLYLFALNFFLPLRSLNLSCVIM